MVTMRRLFSWLTILGLSRLLLVGCVVPGSYSVILKRRRHRFLQSLARHFRARKPDPIATETETPLVTQRGISSSARFLRVRRRRRGRL